MFLTVKRLFLSSQDIMGVMLILNVLNFLRLTYNNKINKIQNKSNGNQKYIQDNYLISTITKKTKIFTFPANTEILKDCNVEK